jgi:ectoine hydroxylase-related dioxygenase (phytanoyl-CoA dioxygenase family)
MGSYEKEKLYSQQAHVITIPEQVRLSGKCTPEIIAEGVSYLHRDGLIVLDNAIDVSHIDTLNTMLSAEALEIAADPDHHFNFGRETRNMDQAPPPQGDMMYKDVWCNPFAAAILSAIIGPKPVVHYANGNTALKATGRQPVHSDCEFEHPNFPFAYVLNINLVDTSAVNGGTELWLGSHHVSTVDCHITGDTSEHALVVKKEYLEERRRHSPPVQATTKRGSLMLRDLRLWHAGMPNKTDDPRVMLAFVMQPQWYQCPGRVLLPRSVKDLVESWSDEMLFAAQWVDGEVDHKKVKSTDVSFDTGNKALLAMRDVVAHRPGWAPEYY